MLNKFKPTTPGLRGTVLVSKRELSKDKPVKSLTKKLNSTGGRNNQGKITSRRMGGGVKRKYRIIDFKRSKLDVTAEIIKNEYDPNRSAFISLIKYEDGELSYIISPKNIKIGEKIISGNDVSIKNGNCLPLKDIPVGVNIHNVEINPGAGGKIARSAGTSVVITGTDGNYALIKMSSGEIRKINLNSLATIGVLSNPDQKNIKIGKAGRSRWMGVRPHTRGVAMNPVDHPLGGGEGKSAGGRHPVSRKGQASKGLKTRDNKRTDKYIVKRRGKKRS